MFGFFQQSRTPDKASPQPVGDGVTLTLPELLQYRHTAHQLAMKSSRPITNQQLGTDKSRALGRGLDFAEVREYKAGDDIRMIDWKVTARSGKPHTKLFHEERERPVFFFIDYRAKMHFGTRNAYKSIAAARITALLAWFIQRAGDRIGGLVFSEEAHLELKPKGGTNGVLRLLQTLVDCHQKTAVDDKDSFSRSLQRLTHVANTGSTVILLSDFHGFDESTQSTLNRIRQHNHCIAIHLFDPLEAQLPPAGRYAVGDDKKMMMLDSSNANFREKYEQRFQAHQNSIKKYFTGLGNQYVGYCTQDDPLAVGEALILGAEHRSKKL